MNSKLLDNFSYDLIESLVKYFFDFFPTLFRVVFVSNWNSKFSTLLNSRHSVQKAVDLTTPGKNRDKMSGKKWHFQIKKMIVFFRKLTWTWQLTSTTHSLPQCALCSINISQKVLIILSYHPTPFFPYLLVKNIIFWGCTEPGSNLENHHFFSLDFGEMEMSK